MADIPWSITVLCEDKAVGEKVSGTYKLRTVLCQGRPMWSSEEGHRYLWWSKHRGQWIISPLFDYSNAFCFLEDERHDSDSSLGRTIVNSKHQWQRTVKRTLGKNQMKSLEISIYTIGNR